VSATIDLGVGRSDWKILVVDDEPTICNLLARLLRKEGMLVEIAHDGKSALDALQRQPPDLLLLDYRLPDMTGQDVLLEARSLLPGLPVIVITAYADVQTAVKSMRVLRPSFLESLGAQTSQGFPGHLKELPLHHHATIRA
jgi:DNA-binding NtrC family response regulator